MKKNSGQWPSSGQGSGVSSQLRQGESASRVSDLHPSSFILQPFPPATRGVPRRAPRGVLLLVVLSLLVLFTLIGVTFVLVASQSRRATRADSRHEQYGDDPQRVLDAVFGQIVRDTTNPRSSLQGHSLLADMYGNDGVKGTLSGVPAPIAGGQFIDFTSTSVNLMSPFMTLPQIQTPGYYNGCVFSIIDGPAANLSGRIVGWDYNTIVPNTYSIRVLAFDNFPAGSIGTITGNFIVNGRPFNGTGFGFNPAALPASDPTLLNAQQQPFALPNATPFPVEFALLPNGRHFVPTLTYTTFGGIGGADEDYDASDPQNLAMAYMPINLPAAPPGPGNPSPILPSFHRPDLINYQFTRAQPLDITGVTHWTQLPPALLRQTMLRPFGPALNAPAGVTYDHPNFTGSNPDFDAINGPWDVDNDGDGVADSIWVDVGMPAQTAPDGRRFKPLAAILCLDLDGRINVNAHGNIAHVDTNPGYTTLPGTGTGHYFAPMPPAPPPPTMNLPRGQGYGPAEINLNPLAGLPPFDIATAAKLLAARYQEPNSSLTVAAPTYNTATMPPVHPYPGITSYDDPLSAIKQFELPLPPAGSYRPNLFGSPIDLLGRGFTALDVRGMPLTPYMGNTGDRFDDPYELNLDRHRVRASISPNTPVTPPVTPDATLNPIDRPFTAAELERVLRFYDVDSSALPDRLLTAIAANSTLSLQQLRYAMTTDSSDLPAPSSVATREMRMLLPGAVSTHIVDLLRARLVLGGANVNLELKKMLPPELVAGQRMDINRPFGNGLDDNNNQVVDEPGENELRIWDSSTATSPTAFDLIAPTLTNGMAVSPTGGVNVNDYLLARQLYARHLYILMMLLTDQAAPITVDGEGPNAPEERARAIAQWAINVVDFRDRDSIMTPFEYDVDPFNTNGWNVDGIVGSADDATESDRRLVWGCERPELLITEALAFHDRRTEDRQDENPVVAATNGQPGRTTDVDLDGTYDKDSDFDQRLRPRGSLFVELYNPWVTSSSNTDAIGQPNAIESPGEFYSLDTAANTASGVLLSAVEPTNNTPVWRLLIVRGTSLLASGQPRDPDDPIVANRPAVGDIERSVYFTQSVNAVTGHGQPYYCSRVAAPLLPGRYAVVGSAGQPGLNNLGAGQYVNTIGRLKTTSASGASQDGISAGVRQILLTPNVDPNMPNQVQVLNNGKSPPEPVYPDIQYPIAVVVDKTIDLTAMLVDGSVSVSEPVMGYPALGFVSGAAAGEGLYSPPLDVPLDAAPELSSTTTTPSYRFIHLQRLANPLIPWNADSNPYLTIDTTPVALTSFNGATDDPEPTPALPIGIAAFQRGDTDAPLANNLWRREAAVTPIPARIVPLLNPHSFDSVLQHSLGYLSTNFGEGANGTAYRNADPPPLPAYNGSPKIGPTVAATFPWLTWNNRPFVGPTELMLVPRSRSSRLLFDYAPSPIGTNYGGPIGSPANPGSGHLLNFFWTAPAGTPSPNYCRILDYVQVPSRFVGTETVLNPGTLSAGLPNEQDLFTLFHPPFNKVSNYRDPGRVNINTIPGLATGVSSPIWDAVLNGTLSPAWQQIVESRRGEVGAGNVTTPLATSPSVFGNPFRSAGGGSLTLPRTPPLPRDDVDVTLLRPLDPATLTDVPLFAYNSISPHEDTTRNPYFRHQTLQRLSNLLTTRSNVYAVWVTVGHFEVSPVPVDPIRYPDGFTLGQEIGSETGEIKRPRAFYIFDRSIPVGFEPGKDHNIDQGTLIKRFIE